MKRIYKNDGGILVPINQVVSRRAFIAKIATIGISLGVSVKAGPLPFSFWKSASSSSVSFFDDFNRADANPMSDPASGGTYVVGPGGMVDLQISSNSARYTANDFNGAMVLTPAFPANQKSTVTLGQAGGGFVRMQGSTDASCYWVYQESATVARLYKLVDLAGTITPTQLGATITLVGAGPGTTITLEAIGTGTVTLNVYQDTNPTPVGTRTDSTAPFNSGQPGICCANFGQLDSALYESV